MFVFDREELRWKVWKEWKKKDTEKLLPEYYYELDDESKAEFLRECDGRMKL